MDENYSLYTTHAVIHKLTPQYIVVREQFLLYSEGDEKSIGRQDFGYFAQTLSLCTISRRFSCYSSVSSPMIKRVMPLSHDKSKQARPAAFR
ncbi:MAG TPA: hypothetical protein DEP43_07505, partial [Ruminococcaceae bacterium]|nr:hypothetical protein [Oscillospiraceae bacterium]